ncbi:MAG: hypothetical protein P8R42_20135 [Candidatus Binatia bacterium]|nr:hypothetical protein [Candidatus Binatia bacterium]
MIAILYGAIWRYWRPTSFNVEPTSLRICFPGREKTVPASEITGARALTGKEFRSEHGWGIRVGAGGL